MIDVKQACKIATEERKEPFVDVITDIESGFVIGTMAEDGEIADLPPVFVNKDSGKAENFFIPEHFEEMKSGKTVDIPSNYRFKE